MMRGKGGRTHRFAESPVLQLALPALAAVLLAWAGRGER